MNARLWLRACGKPHENASLKSATVLDLDGKPVEIVEREAAKEMDVTIGADGFSYTRADDDEEMPDWKKGEFKRGNQL